MKDDSADDRPRASCNESNNALARVLADQLRNHIRIEKDFCHESSSSSKNPANGSGRSLSRGGSSMSPMRGVFDTSHLPRCGCSPLPESRRYSSSEMTTQGSSSPMTWASPDRARSSTSESFAFASCTVHISLPVQNQRGPIDLYEPAIEMRFAFIPRKRQLRGLPGKGGSEQEAMAV